MSYKQKYLKYKEKYLLLKGGELHKNIILLNDLTSIQKEHLYNMYVKTYLNANGGELWYKSKEELFIPSYVCGIILNNNSLDESELMNIKAYCIFQKKKYVNKISLTCHDGTPDGKNEAIQLRVKYINMQNWIIEASGATAWILRKFKSPCITDIDIIKKLLEIDDINEKIVININFTIDDFNNIDDINNPPNKNLFYYYHIYIKDEKEIYKNEETLFGISGCDNFDNNSCERKCV